MSALYMSGIVSCLEIFKRVQTHDVRVIQSLRNCYSHIWVKVEHSNNQVQANQVSFKPFREQKHILTTKHYVASYSV